MQIIRQVEQMQQTALDLRASGKRIGFVPTMGFLHEGHLSLMRLAREQADILVASIFVNPTQFGPNEDFESYPRDIERDEQLCRETGVDIIFYPSADEMYLPDATVVVDEDHLSRVLCGASRPSHFQGVLTVVCKLFNIVQPHAAVFGQKDAQQLRLIQQMVRDLNIPVEIVPGPIVRESDGLAMSSRNTYLDEEQRKNALCLRRALDEAEALHKQGETKAEVILHAMHMIVDETPGAEIDYIELRDWQTLAPALEIQQPTLAALAVRFGKTRLIDNTLLKECRTSSIPEL
jgi:pantoate--beta-alanine ligase